MENVISFGDKKSNKLTKVIKELSTIANRFVVSQSNSVTKSSEIINNNLGKVSKTNNNLDFNTITNYINEISNNYKSAKSKKSFNTATRVDNTNQKIQELINTIDTTVKQLAKDTQSNSGLLSEEIQLVGKALVTGKYKGKKILGQSCGLFGGISGLGLGAGLLKVFKNPRVLLTLGVGGVVAYNVMNKKNEIKQQEEKQKSEQKELSELSKKADSIQDVVSKCNLSIKGVNSIPKEDQQSKEEQITSQPDITKPSKQQIDQPIIGSTEKSTEAKQLQQLVPQDNIDSIKVQEVPEEQPNLNEDINKKLQEIDKLSITDKNKPNTSSISPEIEAKIEETSKQVSEAQSISNAENAITSGVSSLMNTMISEGVDETPEKQVKSVEKPIETKPINSSNTASPETHQKLEITDNTRKKITSAVSAAIVISTSNDNLLSSIKEVKFGDMKVVEQSSEMQKKLKEMGIDPSSITVICEKPDIKVEQKSLFDKAKDWLSSLFGGTNTGNHSSVGAGMGSGNAKSGLGLGQTDWNQQYGSTLPQPDSGTINVKDGGITMPKSSDMKTYTGFGDVTNAMETSGAGTNKVSSGVGDNGGVSYGRNQLASKTGSIKEYIKYARANGYNDIADQLEPLMGDATNNQGQFANKWRQLAADGSGRLQQLDKDYQKGHYFDPGFARLQQSNPELAARVVKNPALKEQMLAMQTNYGENGNKFRTYALQALKDNPNLSDRDLIAKIQDIRAANANEDFRSSSKDWQEGNRQRYAGREKTALLALNDAYEKGLISVDSKGNTQITDKKQNNGISNNVASKDVNNAASQDILNYARQAVSNNVTYSQRYSGNNRSINNGVIDCSGFASEATVRLSQRKDAQGNDIYSDDVKNFAQSMRSMTAMDQRRALTEKVGAVNINKNNIQELIASGQIKEGMQITMNRNGEGHTALVAKDENGNLIFTDSQRGGNWKGQKVYSQTNGSDGVRIADLGSSLQGALNSGWELQGHDFTKLAKKDANFDPVTNTAIADNQVAQPALVADNATTIPKNAVTGTTFAKQDQQSQDTMARALLGETPQQTQNSGVSKSSALEEAKKNFKGEKWQTQYQGIELSEEQQIVYNSNTERKLRGTNDGSRSDRVYNPKINKFETLTTEGGVGELLDEEEALERRKQNNGETFEEQKERYRKDVAEWKTQAQEKAKTQDTTQPINPTQESQEQKPNSGIPKSSALEDAKKKFAEDNKGTVAEWQTQYEGVEMNEEEQIAYNNGERPKVTHRRTRDTYDQYQFFNPETKKWELRGGGYFDDSEGDEETINNWKKQKEIQKTKTQEQQTNKSLFDIYGSKATDTTPAQDVVKEPITNAETNQPTVNAKTPEPSTSSYTKQQMIPSGGPMPSPRTISVGNTGKSSGVGPDGPFKPEFYISEPQIQNYRNDPSRANSS